MSSYLSFLRRELGNDSSGKGSSGDFALYCIPRTVVVDEKKAALLIGADGERLPSGVHGIRSKRLLPLYRRVLEEGMVFLKRQRGIAPPASRDGRIPVYILACDRDEDAAQA